MIRFFLIAIVSIICFQLFISSVYAAFGVSPADLTFEYLSPGMTVEKDFLVSRSDLEKEASVVVETDIDGANNWFKIEPDVNFTIPKGQRTETMKVIISVPEDADYKTYSGYLTLKVTEGEKTAGVSVVGGVGIAAKLTVSKSQVAKLSIKKLVLPSILFGQPIRLLITVENQGNKEASLDKAEIVVRDTLGNELLKSEDDSLDSIEPGKSREIIATFDNKLNPGEYNSNVSVIFSGETIKEDKLVFSVEKPVNEAPTEFKVSEGKDYAWIYLLKTVLVSIIPITIIWVIIRKKYV